MKTHKLNLNKFGVFVLTIGTFALWAWIIWKIMLGLAGVE